MFLIFLIPIVGLAFDALITKIFPKAQFRGYDVLPFFFIPVCNMMTNLKNKPSFLPYGFFLFFILVVIVTVEEAVKNKNIPFGKTLHHLWGYLSLCSIMWYVGLLFIILI
ncbi:MULTISPECIES: DUF3397 family protein [Lactobacillus]|uniref:DUF3397 family protein n=1 Tax=Lactobacillus xujianguonis TaxID=2495899 RepID=A0A437STY4_9LACO|nr:MULTISPECIES: DUF3397 family protein [Lactobacillus]RVU70312.1 DUF3397 family protein [Lactobacillus xujianguonis]RVU73872.1 DUF3397 family protein [Lactobacillus xujianguonis]